MCALMPLTDIDWAREGHGPGHWAETNWEDTGGGCPGWVGAMAALFQHTDSALPCHCGLV